MNTEDKSIINYATSTQRLVSSSIDIFIVFLLRFFFMALLGELWLKNIIIQFEEDFTAKFSTPFLQQNADHVGFFRNHELFSSLIIFYLIIVAVGAFYYAYLHSSTWQATIGKRVINIKAIKLNGMTIGFKRALLYYFLSIMPFIYAMYIMAYVAAYNISLINAVTHSFTNIILTIIFVAWLQAQYFTKNKSTIYDIICRVIVAEGKIDKKYPWYK